MKELENLAKQQSAQFRQQHGLSSDEPVMLNSLLLKENIVTIFKKMSEGFSGMAIKCENDRFMMINSNQTIGRQNFSIAHELYHLFIQDDFIPKLSVAGKFNSKDRVEYQADLFAIYLLMPESGIFSLIPKNELQTGNIGLRTILKVSSYFQVSWDATLNRLSSLQILNSQVKETAKEVTSFAGGIRSLSNKYGGDDVVYSIGNENVVIGDYASNAQKLFEKNIISETSYLKMMGDIGVTVDSLYEYK